MKDNAAAILTHLEATGRASREELTLLLGATGADAAALYAAADRVRAAAVGDEVHLRALLEFSNHCRRNCLYCGVRRERRDLSRYRMRPEEILRTAHAAAALGYRTVVLQSGEDATYTAAGLASLIRQIKRECDAAVTLSIGERTEEEYRLLREAGADRYLLRIETSSPALYRDLHPDSDWHERRERLRVLRRLGYQVGSGVLIGAPGQTVEMLADDLLFLQEFELDMIGVGPFIPHPSTPLGGALPGALDIALGFVALLRLLCPQALIPATTALGALHPEGRERALRAGADVLMVNVTPYRFGRRYDLYPGKTSIGDGAAGCRRAAEELVARLGRRAASGYGDSRLPGAHPRVCQGAPA